MAEIKKTKWLADQYYQRNLHFLEDLHLLTPKALLTIQAFFQFSAYLQTGLNKSNSVTLAARETGISERHLYRFIKRFESRQRKRL